MIQLVDEFFSHRFSKRIAFSTREIGYFARKEHHLLLINRNTICLLQVLLHTRQIISNRLLTLLSLNKLRNVLHRAWTIQRIHCNQVFKSAWLQISQMSLHSGRLELKGSDCIAVRKKLVGRFITDINLINIKINAQT